MIFELQAQSCSLPGNETHQNCNSSRPIPSSFNNHQYGKFLKMSIFS